jgi:hypothetical protein
MRYRTWCTFEFDEQAPETVRGEIVAATLNTAASRVGKAARKARPGRRPRAIVVVLERMAETRPSPDTGEPIAAAAS